jgi:hypothetical protein
VLPLKLIPLTARAEFGMFCAANISAELPGVTLTEYPAGSLDAIWYFSAPVAVAVVPGAPDRSIAPVMPLSVIDVPTVELTLTGEPDANAGEAVSAPLPIAAAAIPAVAILLNFMVCPSDGGSPVTRRDRVHTQRYRTTWRGT